MDTSCNICNGPTAEHDCGLFRNKYEARLRRCSSCGFIFVENPNWLAEAYAEPINISDTGYVERNLWARDKIRRCIDSHLNPDGMFLDYAAGYGLFVRMMRDIGYDFRWQDAYCQNLFCRGFEAPNPLTDPFEAVTAFEVFEHLTDPSEEMKLLSMMTSCLIFSTKLVPEPAPQLKDWWYYGLEHGQHVSFYTHKSLELLASRFGYRFVTNGAELHVFSRKQISTEFFLQPKTKPSRWRSWANQKSKRIDKRVPLTTSDHDFIVRKIAQEDGVTGAGLNMKTSG